MLEHNKVAGQSLRKLRKQRRLTLHQAAPHMNMSAPGLSRRERGQEKIERHDIRRAIDAYELSPWEAHELWIAAGFIPEPTLPTPRNYNLHELAETLLPHVPYPAFIMDMLGYLCAWNQGIEEIWQASHSDSERIHIIDDLFSERVRLRLGDRWEQYVSQAIRVFYTKTIRISNDPDYRQLLDYLQQRHGKAFVDRWNEAQHYDWLHNSLPPMDMGGTVVMYDSPYGMIEYLVMQAVFHFPHEYELFMYVPFGTDNQARYMQLRTTSDSSRLYYRY